MIGAVLEAVSKPFAEKALLFVLACLLLLAFSLCVITTVFVVVDVLAPSSFAARAAVENVAKASVSTTALPKALNRSCRAFDKIILSLRYTSVLSTLSRNY